MPGTTHVQELRAFIAKVNENNNVSGVPGNFSVADPLQYLGEEAAPFDPVYTALVQPAVTKSNDAAGRLLKLAATISPTANTSLDTITKELNGAKTDIQKVSAVLPDLNKMAQEFKALEQGAIAILHWWGWTLKLNEASTKALEELLKNGINIVKAALVPLGAASPPLAAAFGILDAVASGLDVWVTDADNNNHNGVTIRGYLWVGVWVAGNT